MTNNESKIILVRGLPGTGKTTLALKMLKSGQANTYYEADQYFYNSDGYFFDPARLKDAHQWCYNGVKRFLKEQRGTVVVSNTFSQNWEMKPYRDLAKSLGIKLEVIEMMVPYHNSVHITDPNALEETRKRMSARWEEVKWTN